MKVYLLSNFPGPPENPLNFAAQWVRASAAADPFGAHEVTADPENADLILFVEGHPPDDPYVLGTRSHPLYRRFPGKCFLYHDSDFAVPIVRGIYPSLRRRDHQPERSRGGGYIARLAANPLVSYSAESTEKRWLYSFAGDANSAVRQAIFARGHACGLVRDTTGKRLWELRGEEQQAYQQQYVEEIRQSQFVLCPAGLGPTSYRLFEVMEMGGAPVVLSDEWVPPEGPPWEGCALHLPESSVAELESILTRHAARGAEMGRMARRAWEKWFSQPVSFHRLVEWCAAIQAAPHRPFSAFQAWRHLLRAPHCRIWLRHEYRCWRAALFSKTRA